MSADLSPDMSSDEVAEDFRDALQDLKTNSKPEIDILTLIAKENTAHAQAISQVLEEHIKKVRGKRPALL
jgi:pre-mRNA cleavage complex 2 protein Pcf11